MFKPIPRRKVKTVVKGVFSILPKYEVRVPDGDWSPYWPIYENQKWGQWDSDDCWCLSSVNNAAANLNWLLKNNMFGKDALDFFYGNGYILNGSFNLSELFHEILCGNLNNGGTAQEAWQSFASRGFIPRTMLNYSEALANADVNLDMFVTDYYSRSRVTPAMIALGKQFLQYVTISNQGVSSNMQIMSATQKQAPLNLGIPIPRPTIFWNQSVVPAVSGGYAEHEVSLMAINSNESFKISDQYKPWPKTLSAGYNIILVTQGVINAKQPVAVNIVPQPTGQLNNSFWTAVLDYFAGIWNALPVGKLRV